jgi:hypothetical protein
MHKDMFIHFSVSSSCNYLLCSNMIYDNDILYIIFINKETAGNSYCQLECFMIWITNQICFILNLLLLSVVRVISYIPRICYVILNAQNRDHTAY